MKKIAFFVEGLTEQKFLTRLILEIGKGREIEFIYKKQFRNTLIMESESINNDEDEKIYVLIVNCNTDNQVKTQILKEHQSLSNSGYQKIIGLRDLHPEEIKNLHLIEKFINTDIPQTGAPVEQIIAITETEAWFLDELTHFERIHPGMIPAAIVALGYDLIGKRGSEWETPLNPAEVLNKIYANWGLAYKKKTKQIDRTISAIDWAEMCGTVRTRAPSLNQLISSVESALTE